MSSIEWQHNGPFGGNGAHIPSTHDLLEQGRRVRDDFTAFFGSAKYFAQGWRHLVRERLDQQPYATLAVAVGVGYVLGGGVPTGLVRMLATWGGRVALERTVMHYASGIGRS
jgi:hypothetical protein